MFAETSDAMLPSSPGTFTKYCQLERFAYHFLLSRKLNYKKCTEIIYLYARVYRWWLTMDQPFVLTYQVQRRENPSTPLIISVHVWAATHSQHSNYRGETA